MRPDRFTTLAQEALASAQTLAVTKSHAELTPLHMLAALLEERRDERAVTEIIGAEQMSKSGDSDAASALRRVTGLTVVGGRFIYVRGMGERYSSTSSTGSRSGSEARQRNAASPEYAGSLCSGAKSRTRGERL